MTEEEIAQSRRDFLKKMALIGFAVPIVTSFTIDAAAFSGDQRPHLEYPNQYSPNQFFGNQGVPSNFFPGQVFPNQYPPSGL